MVYDPFNILLNAIPNILLRTFYIFALSDIGQYFSLLCYLCLVSVSGDADLINKLRSILSATIFCSSLRRVSINSSLIG